MSKKTWTELTVDMRNLPCIVHVHPHDGKIREYEVIIVEEDQGDKIRCNIRHIGFDGSVQVSSEYLFS